MSTTRSTRSAGSRRRHQDGGTGVIGTTAGVTVFLCTLLLAAQVLTALYARSAVGAAAYDAARIASGADGTEAVAEALGRRALGRFAVGARFEWERTADAVRLRVVARSPSLLPAAWRRPLGLDVVDRTVVVRVERVRS